MIAVMAWSKPANSASILSFIDLHVAKSFNASSELGFLHTTFEGTLSFLREQQDALRNGKRITPTPMDQSVRSSSSSSSSSSDPTVEESNTDMMMMSTSLGSSSSLAQFGLTDAAGLLLDSPTTDSLQLSINNNNNESPAFTQALVWGCAPEPIATPHLVSAFNNEALVAVRCAEKSTYVVTANGNLFISDVFQNLGSSSSVAAGTPFFRQLPALAGIKISMVAAGDSHVICMSEDRRSFVWGQNDFGQLGLGDTTDHATPQFNPLLSTVIQRHNPENLIREIACGDAFSILLSTSGQVWAWGKGEHGCLGQGEDDNHNRAVPYQVRGELDHQIVVQIACGTQHTLCLTDTGQIYAFGSNTNGQLGVTGNRSTTCAMEPTYVSFFDQRFVKMISAGFANSAALVEASVYMWGAGEKGQLGNGELTSKFLPSEVLTPKRGRPVAISCGASHSALIDDSGAVFTWGANRFGQLGTGDFKDQHSPQQLKVFQAFHAESIACGFWQTAAFGAKR